MKTMPMKCKDINKVSMFCDCIADEDSVDECSACAGSSWTGVYSVLKS
jgi:hypothetical protein